MMVDDGQSEEPLWRTIERLVQERFGCDHSETAMTKRIIKGGATTWYKQCRRCGDVRSQATKTRSVPIAVRVAAPPFDEVLLRTWPAQRDLFKAQLWEEFRLRESEGLQRHKEEQAAEWFDWYYNEYLWSDHWKALRQLALERDKWTCQACLRAPAEVVHHLTYEHVGKELLFEVVSVCRPCHTRCHPEKKLRTLMVR